MSALVATLLLVMEVEGAGTCPPPREVERKLAPLLPAEFLAGSTDRATIAEGADGSVAITLSRADGIVVASRRLPPAPSCAEEAETVAVTLAVWQAQIHPEISLRLDRLASATPPPGPAAPPPVAVPAVVRTAAPAAPAAAPWTAGLGAAVLGGWQPGSTAPGVRADATLGPAGGPARLRLSVTALGEHTSSLPPGEARWRRLYAVLGADYGAALSRRWRLTMGLGALVGVLDAEGVGFSMNRTTRGFDLGAEALIRAELRLGAVRPWAGLALVAWLRRQTVEIIGEPSSADLPGFEPLIALGADFCPRC